MKQFSIKIVSLGLAICGFLQASATTRTVNNGTYLPANPGQYSTISAAISAASAGDTILVAGSLTQYGENLNISKQLTIVGAGYNPQYGPSTIVNGTLTLQSGASGSNFIGMYFTGAVGDGYGYYTSSNVTFFRCFFNNSFTIANNVSGLNLIENIFNGANVRFNLSWASGTNTGVVFENNIFTDGATIYEANASSSTPQMVIDHNLFLAGYYSSPSQTDYNYALQVPNAYVTNNIFYGIVPIDTNATSVYNSCSFDNNLTYCSTTIKALPYGNNIGASNINNSNPLFTGIFTSSASPYLSLNGDNLRPQSGSPVLYAASDSSNIGPTGGQYAVYDVTNPFLSGEPRQPMVETITPVSSTSVHIGTPFVIQVTAKEIR